MYVEDVKDGKRTYTHIFGHNFLNIQPIFNLEKVLESWDLEHTIKYCVHLSMSKMSKIDQVHLRLVMLCMSKMLKMVFAAFMQHCIQSYSFCYSCLRCQRCQILGIIDQRLKIHTNMFLLITSLIFNRFSIFPICRRCGRYEILWIIDQILCMSKNVKDVEDALSLSFPKHFLDFNVISGFTSNSRAPGGPVTMPPEFVTKLPKDVLGCEWRIQKGGVANAVFCKIFTK